MRTTVQGGILLALIIPCLAACGGSAGSSGSPGGGGDRTASTTQGAAPSAEDSSAPGAEGSGPESPQASQGGGPVLSVPSLPTGGDAAPSQADPSQHCANVSWVGVPNDFPHDITLSVDKVELDTSGAFELGGDGCDSGPPCDSWVWTWDNNSAQCHVSARQVGAEGTAKVVIHATLHCPTQQACEEFASRMGSTGNPPTFDAGQGTPAGG